MSCTFLHIVYSYTFVIIVVATIHFFTLLLLFLVSLMSHIRCIMLGFVIIIRLTITEVARTGTAVQQTLLLYLLNAT